MEAAHSLFDVLDSLAQAVEVLSPAILRNLLPPAYTRNDPWLIPIAVPAEEA